MNKVSPPKLRDKLNVGWAKVACPTKQSLGYDKRNKKHNTAWTNQCETLASSRSNVGHVTIVPLPNLQLQPPKTIKCRLGKEQRAQQHRAAQSGITYIEIMIVVFILAITAVVVIPNLSSHDSRKLDLAAAEIAEAIRFARTEAMRTGIPHGVIFSTGSDNVKVYRLLSGTQTYDVYHPVSKKIYTLNLKTDSATTDVELQSYIITYGLFNQSFFDFNTYGNPKYYSGGTDYMLTSGSVTLAYAGQTRVISVAPMTGRVTVQ